VTGSSPRVIDEGQPNGGIGAAWVFSRSGGVWAQQGPKLVGSGNIGFSYQGFSVSLSADGNTAIVGGMADNSNTGAAWVFTRSNGVWTQQGNKLVGTGADGGALQGFSVAVSGDGDSAIVGGLATTRKSGRHGFLSGRVHRCKSPPPPTWSLQAIQAAPSPPHHSNIN
jgi:hypothetical protein